MVLQLLAHMRKKSGFRLKSRKIHAFSLFQKRVAEMQKLRSRHTCLLCILCCKCLEEILHRHFDTYLWSTKSNFTTSELDHSNIEHKIKFGIVKRSLCRILKLCYTRALELDLSDTRDKKIQTPVYFRHFVASGMTDDHDHASLRSPNGSSPMWCNNEQVRSSLVK